MDGIAGGAFLIFTLLLVLVGLASTVFWIWSIIDAVKRPDDQWDAAGQNKVLWLVVVIVVGFIGSVLYWLIPRPALKRIEASSGVQFDPTAFGVPDGGMTRGHDGFEPPRT